MNNRFKFRVWDKKNNRWLLPYPTIDTKQYTFEETYKRIPSFAIGGTGRLVLNDSRNFYFGVYNDEDYVIQQYTGLRDKNGKEIYEGDLLVFDKNIEGEKSYRYSVIFKFGKFELKMPDSSMCIDIYHYRKMVVVGNIFENPELFNK